MRASWPKFAVMLMSGPVLDMLRELYKLTSGDVEKASNKVRHIIEHGLRYDEAKELADERMERLRKKQEPNA